MPDLLERYRALLEEVDGWFAGSLDLYPDAIRCRRGCSGCCRGLFDITLLDAALLQRGLDTLPPPEQSKILDQAVERLARLQEIWPGMSHPFLLNDVPEEEWSLRFDRDDTQCLLLDAAGDCRLYPFRPLTCRLHGIPNLDQAGNHWDEGWCSLNFAGHDPLPQAGLAWDFERLFGAEGELLRAFSRRLTGTAFDTLIPTALLIDFDRLNLPQPAPKKSKNP